MEPINKEKIKEKIRKEIEAMKMVEEILNELGGRDATSGPFSVAKEFYAHRAVSKIIGLCSYYTDDEKLNRAMAEKIAIDQRTQYHAYRKTGFDRKEALALCCNNYFD